MPHNREVHHGDTAVGNESGTFILTEGNNLPCSLECGARESHRLECGESGLDAQEAID